MIYKKTRKDEDSVGRCIEKGILLFDKVIKANGFGRRVDEIGWQALSGIGRKHMEIESGIKKIEGEAFINCKGIQEIYVPQSVISIKTNAFQMKSIKNIRVDKDNEYYKDIDGNLYTKDGSVLIKYAIGKEDSIFYVPNGVKRIDDWAFEECRNLKTVVLPKGIMEIGMGAFCKCVNLTKVYLPEELLNIKERAFESCKYLAKVIMPKNANLTIEKEAFSKCKSLKKITFPQGELKINEKAFFGCEDLEGAYFPDGTFWADENAFEGNSKIRYYFGGNQTWCGANNSSTFTNQKIDYSYVDVEWDKLSPKEEKGSLEIKMK